jgi:hypothetical protein
MKLSEIPKGMNVVREEMSEDWVLGYCQYLEVEKLNRNQEKGLKRNNH